MIIVGPMDHPQQSLVLLAFPTRTEHVSGKPWKSKSIISSNDVLVETAPSPTPFT